MTISLIHPSRNRPEKAFKTHCNWINSLSDKVDFQYILSIDNDDFYKMDYAEYFGGHAIIISNGNKSAVDAINKGAKYSTGDILVIVSDDTDCLINWDEYLLKLVDGKNDWILKTNDGVQPWIITSPILDRTYYNRFGYIYHPDYKHMFCDTELTCVADLTGRKITSNILFKHNHYSVTKESPDAISKRADATWDQGEKLFLERYKRNFDLRPEDIKGKIQDNGMINWLQRKAR